MNLPRPLGLIVFGAGIGLGLGLVVGRLTAPVTPAKPLSDQIANGGNGPSPRRRGDRLADQESNRSARKGSEARNVDDLIISPSLLADLSASFQKRTLKNSLFDREDLIAEHLEISPNEKALIETSWRGVKDKIKSMEADQAVVNIPGDGPATITVPDLSAGLGGVSQGLRGELDSILGAERAAIFASAKQLDRILETSEGERRYEISFEPLPNDRWRYRITSDGKAGKRTWVTEGLIPDEIRHLTDASGIDPRANEEGPE